MLFQGFVQVSKDLNLLSKSLRLDQRRMEDAGIGRCEISNDQEIGVGTVQAHPMESTRGG